VSPGLTTYVTGAPSDTYPVSEIDVGGHSLALAWGRLVAPLFDPASWTMYIETISYGRMDPGEYEIKVFLKDGRCLLGRAALETTNGRLYRFEGRGEWPDLMSRSGPIVLSSGLTRQA
jgi:hypothetical protein